MRYLIRFCCSNSRLLIQSVRGQCMCVSACKRVDGMSCFCTFSRCWSCGLQIRGFRRPHQSSSYFTAVRGNGLGLLSRRHMLMISGFTSWFVDPHGQQMNNALQVQRPRVTLGRHGDLLHRVNPCWVKCGQLIMGFSIVLEGAKAKFRQRHLLVHVAWSSV